MARYEVGLAFPATSGAFPWATFAINTSGAFVLGLLLVLILERWRGVSAYVRPLCGVGFLGAWTTMSTLAIEAALLAKDGHLVLAVAYLLATLGAGAAAAALGIVLGRSREVMR